MLRRELFFELSIFVFEAFIFFFKPDDYLFVFILASCPKPCGSRGIPLALLTYSS